MNLDIIQSLRETIKITLSPVSSQKGPIVMMALSKESKEKMHSIESFIPEITRMIQELKDNLKKTAPHVEELKTQLNHAYAQKNQLIDEQRRLTNDISTLENQITELNRKYKSYQNEKDMFSDKRDVLCGTLHEKRSRLNQMKGELAIPFYGLTLIDAFKKLKNRTIPDLENQIRECDNDIKKQEGEMEQCQITISSVDNYREELLKNNNQVSLEMKKCDVTINNARQAVAGDLKNMAYLSILEEKMKILSIDSSTIHEVMNLLDQDPEVIEYEDDQIYFNTLQQWNQNHDDSVFQAFIMQSGKDFFDKLG